MTQMNASNAIAEGLITNGVDTVFGLPGAQMYDLFEAFYQYQDKLRVIGARHEQGLGYMAFGYARSTGRLGVYSAVPGPGVLNSTAALCTAYGANTPLLCLTGEVPTSFMGQGRGHLHELPDQLSLIKGVTKWATHVAEPAETPAQLNAAITAACSGRQGPVSLQLCWDDFGRMAEMESLSAAEMLATPDIDPDDLLSAAKLIKEARAPMIFVGSGAQHAGAEINELAEMLEAPVIGFRGGRGIVGDDRDMGLTMAAAFKLWPDTDLMIGIGSRMEIPFMRWGSFMNYLRRMPGKKLVRLDIDPAEMDRLDTDAGIIADAKEGSRKLIDALSQIHVTASGRRDKIAAAKATSAQEIQDIQPQVDYLGVIRDVLPRDGFLVDEVCQVGFATPYAFPVYEPLTFVSGGYQGNLGFGFPTSLGVKVANPDKAVISITGDGGFMFGIQELATAVQYDIAVVVIVFNNSAYGNVRRDQQQRYDNHIMGADLQNPDFVKLAEAFGVTGYRATSPAELRPLLEKALALGKPAVIEVVQDKGSEASPWKYLMA
ncbi:Acetohydroxy acid synthase [hydrothermal vent metagenome]|uniref:Acetohydroxy acid synthase n=1 Tax=hydrothermal vent metagenome TaxID=652676 RepID=A0A3B0S625_9ZZZZ